MQYGSRHERHELATRNLSNRRPSRISRVTPWWVSAQALVHSSQRVHFSRSSTSRLWAFISPWSRKRLERLFLDLPDASLVVLPGACAPRRSRPSAAPGDSLEDRAEVVGRDPHQVDVVEGRAGGGANAGGGQVAELGEVRKQADLADVAARARRSSSTCSPPGRDCETFTKPIRTR